MKARLICILLLLPLFSFGQSIRDQIPGSWLYTGNVVSLKNTIFVFHKDGSFKEKMNTPNSTDMDAIYAGWKYEIKGDSLLFKIPGSTEKISYRIHRINHKKLVMSYYEPAQATKEKFILKRLKEKEE